MWSFNLLRCGLLNKSSDGMSEGMQYGYSSGWERRGECDLDVQIMKVDPSMVS